MIKFFLIFALYLFASLPALADQKFDLNAIEKEVDRFQDSKDSLTLKNGRRYTLDLGVIIETLDFDTLEIKHNLFDIENGLLIHSPVINSKEALECQQTITSFNNLRADRVNEVIGIGCLLYNRMNRLTSRHDELDSFNKKFCQDNK